jgi:hypothetical protein
VTAIAAVRGANMGKDKASQEEIYRAMRRDIEAGSYPASSRLPSVRTLARRFNASPNTISKVVSRLMESGLCTARRGVGLFVRSLPSRKISLLMGGDLLAGPESFEHAIEVRLAERLAADGVEIERISMTAEDTGGGPAADKVRKPGRVIMTLGCVHEPYIKTIHDLRRPLLVVGHAPSRCSASAVLPNSFKAGYLAARHLIRQGRRNIAFVGRRRRIRSVALPESESLKELAGVQCAFLEEGMHLRGEFIFPDLAEVADQAARLKDLPDAVIMPASDTVAAVQAVKALGKVDRVLIGDDRLLDRARRPHCVVYKREDFVDLILLELERQLGETNKLGIRTHLVDCEFHEGAADA